MSTSHAPHTCLAHRLNARRTAFTFPELLIVIGIIVALISLLLPSVARTMRSAERTRMVADIQTLGTGLEAYRQDHGDYPRVYETARGANTLGRALIGPESQGPPNGDGADGPGFRTRLAIGGVPQSKVYGPYVDPDRFTIDGTHIMDRIGRPYLYYYAHKANTNAPGGFVTFTGHPIATGTQRPRYNASDNYNPEDDGPNGPNREREMSTGRLQVILGDVNRDGRRNGPPADLPSSSDETAAFDGPYLIISAGQDGLFGPEQDAPISRTNRCDDITNFPRNDF